MQKAVVFDIIWSLSIQPIFNLSNILNMLILFYNPIANKYLLNPKPCYVFFVMSVNFKRVNTNSRIHSQDSGSLVAPYWVMATNVVFVVLTLVATT